MNRGSLGIAIAIVVSVSVCAVFGFTARAQQPTISSCVGVDDSPNPIGESKVACGKSATIYMHSYEDKKVKVSVTLSDACKSADGDPPSPSYIDVGQSGGGTSVVCEVGDGQTRNCETTTSIKNQGVFVRCEGSEGDGCWYRIKTEEVSDGGGGGE